MLPRQNLPGKCSCLANLINFDITVGTLTVVRDLGVLLLVHYYVQFKLCTMMYSIHTRRSYLYFTILVQGIVVNQRRSGLRFAWETAQVVKMSKLAFVLLHWTT